MSVSSRPHPERSGAAETMQRKSRSLHIYLSRLSRRVQGLFISARSVELSETFSPCSPCGKILGLQQEIYLLLRASQTSRCFHTSNNNPSTNPKLELLVWNLAYIQLTWTPVEAPVESFTEADGNRWKLSWKSMKPLSEATSTEVNRSILPSMEVGGS